MLCCAVGVAAVAITIDASGVDHPRIHATHARDPQLISGDPLPLCRGSNRTTDISSNED